MKRFAWPLARLLDVTALRERALRTELTRLAAQIASAGRRIDRRNALLRGALAELAAQGLPERLPNQQTFLLCSATARKEIQRMEDALALLAARRSETMAKFLKARSSRRSLENLRRRAQGRYRRELGLEEQKHLDEVSRIAHVRKALGAAAVPGAAGADECLGNMRFAHGLSRIPT